LRDSGQNSPTGGALVIDFLGNSRVINSTIDRGAIEAPPPTPVGPQVTPNSPVTGATTWLIGEPGEPVFSGISFNVSGGVALGTTQISCQVTVGTIQIGTFPEQMVGVGQSAEPVLIGFDLTSSVHTGVIPCIFSRVGFGNTFAAYTFKGGVDELFRHGFEFAPP